MNSFTQTFLPLNSGVSTQLNAISFSNQSMGIVVGNSGVIRKTSNAGLTWSASSSGTSVDLTDVTFIDATTFIAIGKLGTILKTTNAGGSWTAVSSNTNNDLLGVFANGSRVYISGANGIVLASINGGNAWTTVNSGTSFHLNKVYFVSEFVGFAVGDGGTILKTNNGGQAWNFLTSGNNTHSLRSVYFIDDNVGVATGGIVGSNESVILRTLNGGQTWSSTNYPNMYLNALGFMDYSLGYAVGGSITGNTSSIYKTTSQGTSWTLETSTSSRQLGVCIPTSNLAFTCGLNGTILRFASNTVGMEESDADLMIQISPNPSHGVFYVSSEANSDFSIEILSVNGERLAFIEVGNQIDLTSFPDGIYMAVIKSESSTVIRKLVKE